MKWYLKVLKNYAVFGGRASRTEYWMFILFQGLFGILLGFIIGILSAVRGTEQSVLVNIYSLATLIPSIAVAWRRMHDTNRSGWWSIVPIVGFIFALSKGTKGDNNFGPDPWGSSQY